MMKWLTRGILVLLVLSGIAAVVFVLLPAPLDVETAVVRRGTFIENVENEGKTRLRDRYLVAAPLAGTLSRVDLKVGDPIKRGGVIGFVAPALTPLDDPRTKLQLAERLGVAEALRLRATAVVARAQAKLDQAKTDLARAQSLAKSGVVSAKRREDEELNVKVYTRELETAQFEAHMAEHLVELARAAMAAGGTRAEEAPIEIQSPIDGVVTKVLQQSEGPISLGAPIVELGDPRQLEIVADVLTTDAVQIVPGAAATIDHWGGATPLEARVRHVEPAAFTKVSALGVDEQRVNVVLDIMSPPDKWKTLGDAFRVETRIEIFRLENALIAPASALFRDAAGGWSLFTIDKGRARRQSVTVIRRGRRDVALAGGIAEGTMVIVFPPDNLKDGTRVRPKNVLRTSVPAESASQQSKNDLRKPPPGLSGSTH